MSVRDAGQPFYYMGRIGIDHARSCGRRQRAGTSPPLDRQPLISPTAAGPEIDTGVALIIKEETEDNSLIYLTISTFRLQRVQDG
jgi:hypothetical protein